ncbi:MAG: phospholipase D-like domain-containing protein [Pleomorphochaeta sp.]
MKLTKIIKRIILIYILYSILTAVLLFAFHKSNKEIDTSYEKYFGQSKANDRALIIEERDFSAKAKIQIIENAKDTLDISYYKIQSDEAGDLFFAKVIEAANRGVSVNIVLDGKINKISNDISGLNYLLSTNPNINIRYYEPLNLLMPWTFNNILHDKYIIADNKIAILGGRNIGNQYFDINGESFLITNDREVLIINTEVDDYTNSSIYQISKYFDEVFNSKYTKEVSPSNLNRMRKKAQEKEIQLNIVKEKLQIEYPNLFNSNYDFLKMSVETNKITLIHNPIERLNKTPICWNVITSLMNNANNYILVQSPYIIPTNKMMNYIDYSNLENKKVEMLTNSEFSTPNFFAFAGYLKYKKDLLNEDLDIYEYQGEGSIHAKSYIIDDNISIIGSFNMDSRSTYLSTETMLIIDSEDLVNQLNKKIDIIKNDSILINEDVSNQKRPSIIKSIVLKIISIITYPFSYLL